MSTEYLVSSGLLDELDGLNPTRALILEAYYAMRRTCRPTEIGTPQIGAWIKRREPNEALPSDSLILLTLHQAEVVHRGPGRPRNDHSPMPAPPLFPRNRLLPRGWVQR